MNIDKQAEVGTWLQEVKTAADHLNKKLAEMPEYSDLEVDVSVNQVAMPEMETPKKKTCSIQDIRGLANEETVWQVNVAVRQTKKLL